MQGKVFVFSLASLAHVAQFTLLFNGYLLALMLQLNSSFFAFSDPSSLSVVLSLFSFRRYPFAACSRCSLLVFAIQCSRFTRHIFNLKVKPDVSGINTVCQTYMVRRLLETIFSNFLSYKKVLKSGLLFMCNVYLQLCTEEKV